MTHWMHGIANSEVHAPRLARAGFTTVVVPSVHEVSVVSRAGLEVWLCGGGFPLVGEDARNLAVGMDGHPHVWFNSASPCSSEVRDASLEAYRRLCAADGVTGVLVDGCRFASPASGTDAFLTDFSDHARRRAREYGMDVDVMAKDLARLRRQLLDLANPRVLESIQEYPGVLDWLSFRRRCVTDHFREIAAIVHEAGKLCGAYVFAPGLAPLVGQSYADLAGIVDLVSPMLYRSYRHAPGIAALNHELASLAEGFAPAVVAATMDALGYAEVVPDPDPAAIRTGLDARVIGTETARARAALGDGPGPRLVPIIQLDDPDRAGAARAAAEAGADAVNHFVFDAEWERWMRP